MVSQMPAHMIFSGGNGKQTKHTHGQTEVECIEIKFDIEYVSMCLIIFNSNIQRIERAVVLCHRHQHYTLVTFFCVQVGLQNN
jgi:hypothetical protein